jgi:hypothetical protein
MLDKLKRALRVLFFVHLVVGFVLIVWLALVPDMVIGTGEFDEMARSLETFDFKWWVVALVAGYWAVPIALVVVWRRARSAGLEADRVRQIVHDMLAGTALPVMVDIDHLIPLEMDEPVNLPIHLDTRIDIDDTVEVDAQVPIHAELPIDADIVTKVLGIGNVKIPLRTKLPIQMMVPIKGQMRLKAIGLPVKVDAVAQVEVRGIQVPLKGRFETKIDLVSNLATAEKAIAKLSGS